MQNNLLSSSETVKTIAEEISPKKGTLSLKTMSVLGILAGAYISLGAMLSILVGSDAKEFFGFGVTKLLSGAAFSLGLILVALAGAELFTGNTLMVTGWLSKKITGKQLLRNWGIVYITNLIGSLLIVLLYFYSDTWQQEGNLIGMSALKIAEAKISLPFMVLLIRGIFANWLVCLAMYLGYMGKTILSKFAGIIFPVTAFVALGFEHSIANMFFIPFGIFLRGAESMQGVPLVFTNVSWMGFMYNLIPVTLGNIIGGGVFVGMVYWYVYIKRKK